MDWTRKIDAYCERMGPEYWAEPVNAVTNAAFLIAALVMAARLRGSGLPVAWILTVVLALIGLGSFLFHTHAQAWSAIADSGAIAVFILIYLFAASRDYLGLSGLYAGGSVVAFFPFAALLVPVLQHLPVLGVSAGYLPVVILIAIYAVILARKSPATAKGLAIGAGLLLISLTARSLDQTLCAQIPFGTHFLWHIFNAIMLGWMIEVYRRHSCRPAP